MVICMPLILQEQLAQDSTTGYVSLLKCRITERQKCTIVISNSHAANGIKYVVWVSNDPLGSAASFATEKTEATLAALACERHVLSGSFAWVDVRIIDASGGAHGIGNAWLHSEGT